MGGGSRAHQGLGCQTSVDGIGPVPADSWEGLQKGLDPKNAWRLAFATCTSRPRDVLNQNRALPRIPVLIVSQGREQGVRRWRADEARPS